MSEPRAVLPLLSAAVLLLGLSTTAAALEFAPSADGSVIRVQGPIEQGDTDKLKKLLREDPRYQFGRLGSGITLHLHSPGGNVVGGIELANFVRERGMHTHIGQGSGCHSACTFVFMGGVTRTSLGQFGIHRMSKGSRNQITTFSDRDLEAVQQLTSTLIVLANNLIGDARVITQMLTVPAEDIRVLKDAEMSDFRIITAALRPTQRMKASFDCGRENLGEVEKLICDHLGLADADRRMAAAYEWLVKHDAAKDLRVPQEHWLKYRDSCRHVVGPSLDFGRLNCLQQAYELRLKQLEGLVAFRTGSNAHPAATGWKEHAPAKDLTKIGTQN